LSSCFCTCAETVAAKRIGNPRHEALSKEARLRRPQPTAAKHTKTNRQLRTARGSQIDGPGNGTDTRFLHYESWQTLATVERWSFPDNDEVPAAIPGQLQEPEEPTTPWELAGPTDDRPKDALQSLGIRTPDKFCAAQGFLIGTGSVGCWVSRSAIVSETAHTTAVPRRRPPATSVSQ